MIGRKIKLAIVAAISLVAANAATAQIPNLPSNTVFGRLANGTGPGQTIPFATLAAKIFGASTSVDNGLICWNGTTGGALKDCGLALGKSISLSPVGNAQGLLVTQAPSGTTAGHQYLNRINVTSDSVDTANDTLAAFAIAHNFGGSTASGFRYGSQAILVLNSATKTTGAGNLAQPIYAGGLFGFQPTANDNGTGGSKRSWGMGLNAYVVAGAGATHFDTITAISADVSTPSGTLPRYRAGINIMEEGSQSQGSQYDAALGISGIAGGQIGFKNGVLFGPLLNGGTAPMSTDATLFATTGSATVAKGIDWSSYTFSGNQITGVGFHVDSGGSPFFNQYNIVGASSGTISINPQAAAGTFNFNLPTTAGASGSFLTSGGGGGSPMTWTAPGTGCATWLATPSSANLRSCVTDETGTGSLYFQNGDIGTPSAGVATNLTGIPTNQALVFGTSFASVDSAATKFYGAGNGAQDSTEAKVAFQRGAAGTVKNCYFTASAAPGVGNTWTYTFRKNGADQAITQTISGGSQTTNSDLTHTVSIVATDLIDFKVVASATVTASVTHGMACTLATTSP